MDSKRRRIRLALALGLLFLAVKYLHSRSTGETRFEPEHWPARAREAPAEAPVREEQARPPSRVDNQEDGEEGGGEDEAGWNPDAKELLRPKWTRPSSNVISLTSGAWPPPRDGYREDGRYLTYLAHSGFHNQRIALTNGLTLAWILNRTLLVPPSTLGVAVDWAPSPKLQRNIEIAESSTPSKCRKIRDKAARRAECGIYWDSRRMWWSWLLDTSAISSLQPVITRPSHSRAFFSDALGLSPSDIHTFPDRKRLSTAFFDSPNAPLPDDFKYVSRMNVDELRAMKDVKLLEFGSLFGSTRLELVEEENVAHREKVRDLMAFDQPILGDVRDEIADRLGGAGSYVGLHLRVGGKPSDTFHIGVRERTESIFRDLLAKAYNLPEALIDDLVATRQPDPDRPSHPPTTIPRPIPGQAFHPSPSLSCPGALYPPHSPLAALNRPLYIATDSRDPRRDPLLALFANTFPCWFVWNDFSRAGEGGVSGERVEQLEWMVGLRDAEGEGVGGMLVPFVEAMVVASADVVVGTPQSTFSNFVKTTLHWAYRGKPEADYP